MHFPNMDGFLDWQIEKLPHRKQIAKPQMSTNAIQQPISHFGKLVAQKMEKIFGSLLGDLADRVGILNVVL